MEDMQQMEQDIKEGGLDVATPEQAAEITPQVEELFKQSYKIMYEDEKFDVLVNQIRETDNVVQPVIQFLVAILDAVVKTGGEISIDVLGNLGLLLLGDVMTSLEEVGIDIAGMPPEDHKKIIQDTITGVLNNNPEFADKLIQDPKTQEFMQRGQGAGQQIGPGSMPKQGVMGSVPAQQAVAEEVV